MSVKPEIVKDAIHGYVKIFDHEKAVIDTPIFQRLRRIKQNTGADYVYPCATQTRFSHSLGVMHTAGVFTEEILDQIKNISSVEKQYYYFLMRLWGLTHDIGQGPFSHLFDDVILSDYDKDHETVGAEILRSCTDLPEIFRIGNEVEINRDDVAQLLEVKTIEDWPMTDVMGSSNFNEKMLFYIGHGAYSADLMDYVLRDSYFTGAGYGNIDWQRLVYASKPFEDKILLDIRGEEAFDSLLLSRLFMFSTVYYHRTTRSAIKIMNYFLREAKSRLDFGEFVEDLNKYASLDEDFLLFHPNLKVLEYTKRLISRKIPYSQVEERSLRIDNTEISDLLQEDILSQRVRTKLPRKLQDLPEEAFFVDTPKIPMNPMLGEEFVYISDPQVSRPFIPRPIWETSWGRLSREVAIVRLYIHDDYRKYEDKIIEAFRRRVRRTYY